MGRNQYEFGKWRDTKEDDARTKPILRLREDETEPISYLLRLSKSDADYVRMQRGKRKEIKNKIASLKKERLKQKSGHDSKKTGLVLGTLGAATLAFVIAASFFDGFSGQRNSGANVNETGIPSESKEAMGVRAWIANKSDGRCGLSINLMSRTYHCFADIPPSASKIKYIKVLPGKVIQYVDGTVVNGFTVDVEFDRGGTASFQFDMEGRLLSRLYSWKGRGLNEK